MAAHTAMEVRAYWDHRLVKTVAQTGDKKVSGRGGGVVRRQESEKSEVGAGGKGGNFKQRRGDRCAVRESKGNRVA